MAPGRHTLQDINETLSFSSNTTWVRGSHALKFGYGLMHARLNQANSPILHLHFDGVTAGLQANGANLPNTGITFAGFLSGYVRQAVFNKELTSWLRDRMFTAFIQDDWKSHPA